MTERDPDQVAEVDPLAQAVQSAQNAHDVARTAADAARQALADAESAVASYEQRVQSGDLPVTPGTLASKRDAVELSRLALPAVEKREAEALALLRTAVVAQTVHRVAEDPRLTGQRMQDATDQARALFTQAIAVLSDAAEERNRAVTESADALAAVKAPIAVRRNFTNTEVPEPGSVHLLTGAGTAGVLMPDGRELMPVNARRWAEREVAKVIKAALPREVRKDIP